MSVLVVVVAAFVAGVGIGVVTGSISAVLEFKRNVRKDMMKE